ncbi:unnamed protein product [Parnassius apollo]|uniref:(apollo) hypothetical protein n=1 Tax=Parnassius apollo TaxID=110799 RepID=A0A8S3WJ64_PARAO|nr:unnamed protein product [Parnassius apollo]
MQTLRNSKNHQVVSQNTLQSALALPSGPIIYRECVKEGSNSNNASPTPQLLNTVLTIAAAKGVLPDILPQIQPTRTVSPETKSTTQELTPQNIDIVPLSQSTSFYKQEPVFANTQSIATAIPKPNAIIPTSSTAYTPPNFVRVPTVPPLIISPGLNQNTQQNNPFIPSISEFAQLQSPVLNPQTIEEPCHCSQVSEKSEQMTLAPALIIESTPSTLEITNESNLEPICTNSILTTEYGQSFPINLHITIPPPNIEAPRITFINAALPTPSPEKTASVDESSFTNPNFLNGYLSQPLPQQVVSTQAIAPIGYGSTPIVYSQNDDDNLGMLLTILLLASRSRNCNGMCGHTCSCCNCCSCGDGSKSIPIPYPIPFPTNNAIVSPRYNPYYDDDEEDDDDDEQDNESRPSNNHKANDEKTDHYKRKDKDNPLPGEIIVEEEEEEVEDVPIPEKA